VLFIQWVFSGVFSSVGFSLGVFSLVCHEIVFYGVHPQRIDVLGYVDVTCPGQLQEPPLFDTAVSPSAARLLAESKHTTNVFAIWKLNRLDNS